MTAPSFSRQLLLAASDILPTMGHSGFDRFLLELGIPDLESKAGRGTGSLRDRANAVARFALDNRDQRTEKGELLEQALVFKAATLDANAPPEGEYYNVNLETRDAFRRALQADSVELTDGRLVVQGSQTPVPNPRPRANLSDAGPRSVSVSGASVAPAPEPPPPAPVPAPRVRLSDPEPDRRKVMVVHGRDAAARDAIFNLLRCVGLIPIEWNHAVTLTGKASPYVGEILTAAFAHAQAVVVVLSGDDEARLRPGLHGLAEPAHESQFTPQARPNVLFEAGMALASHPDRTLLLEIGALRPFSDVGGRHTIRIVDGGAGERNTIVERLRTANCAVETSGKDWLDKPFFGEVLRPPVSASTPVLSTGPMNASILVHLDYQKKQITSDLHQYDLVASITNKGTKRFDDWELEVDFPTALVEPHIVIGSKVLDRSNAKRSLFRMSSSDPKQPLRAGDTKVHTIPYRVDKRIYFERRELLQELVFVRAFVNGELMAEVQKSMSQLNSF